MSTAHVELRLPDGRRALVPAGGIVGRLASAHARVMDARVSEAHALVVLRGRTLKLLALRGLMEVDGQRPPEVTLARGMKITLAEGVDLFVEEVYLPEEVLALVINGSLVELGASDLSIVPGPRPTVVPRYVPGAPVHVVSTGEGWELLRAGKAEPVAEGRSWFVEGIEIRAVALPLAGAGSATTQAEGRLHPPVHIVARHDSAEVTVGGRPTASITGRPAELLSELVIFDKAVDWRLVAEEIWGQERWKDEHRDNYDKTLRKLRANLRDAGVTRQLVRTSGGTVWLDRLPGDEWVDQT